MSDELRPCPFCESIDLGSSATFGTVWCNQCTRSLMRSDWNCRPIEDALRAEVAKYRGMEVENAGLRTDNEELRGELAAIGKDAPKALAALGSRLTEMLDDDQWNEVEPMLAAIQLGHAAEVAALRAESAEWERRAERHLRRYHDTVQAGIDEIAALRDEADTLRNVIAMLKGDDSHALCRDDADRYQWEIAALKAMYAWPLTDEQAQAADSLWAIDMGDDYQSRAWDAAIRAAREGER